MHRRVILYFGKMSVQMKKSSVICSFIFIIVVFSVNGEVDAASTVRSNENNLEWTNYNYKMNNNNQHLRKNLHYEFMEQQQTHPSNMIEPNQSENDINYVSKPKLNIYVPEYLVNWLFVRYGTPYIVGMGHAAFNQIRQMLHRPIVFEEFIPQDYRDIFDGQISSSGKYSYETENFNWTINFGSNDESSKSKQQVEINWHKVRQSRGGKSNKMQIEIHLPKIESDELVKSRAAYSGGYFAMKTIMRVEEYILDMMFNDKF